MIFWNSPPPPPRLKADQVCAFGDGLFKGKTGCGMIFEIKPNSDSEDQQFNASHCQVTFEGPSKPDIKFKTGENNIVNCCWMAFLPGNYKIIIRYDSDQIPGSPFTCNVIESENGVELQEKQLAKIICSGKGLKFGLINEPNEVRVNEVNGMIGGLRVSMEGPGKPVISFRTNTDDGSLSMFYQVPNPGNYFLNIKFMDNHVNGSPFQIKIE